MKARIFGMLYYIYIFFFIKNSDLLIHVTWFILQENKSSPRILVGSVLLIFLVFSCFVLCYYVPKFTFWVPCCDVRYDFRIKTMFGSSLPPVVCRRDHVLFTLFVFVCVQCCLTHIVFFFVLCTLCCQFLWVVHFWLPLRYSLMLALAHYTIM